MQLPRANPTMWFKVYVALAVASVGIACLSIWLGSTLITAHRDSAHLHARWGARLNQVADLSSRAAAAHAAVAGESGYTDIGVMWARLRHQAEDFDARALVCLEDLHALPDDDLMRLVIARVQHARVTMRRMLDHGEAHFEAISAGDAAAAWERIALFNRAYSDVQRALAPIRTAIHESLGEAFRAQIGESERLERVQYVVAGLVCIGVIVAMWYGRRLFEAMRTAEREHEAYLRAMAERRDAAEAASIAKGEFLADMSHEIRTPMTAMLGFAELLADSHQSVLERDQCVRTIRRSGEHLLAILNGILDLSKIEAGRMMLDEAEYAPVQVVEEVFALMQPSALEVGLELQAEYRFPLPRTMKGDPLRLKQIVLNLVSNAIKFTQGGTVTIRVEMVERQGSVLSLSVIDTGIGMTSEEMAGLFRPFVQGEGPRSRRSGGSGLGLSICRRLADLMGATIEVQSRIGEGSTFTVSLPVGALSPGMLAHRMEDAVSGAAASPTVLQRLEGRVLVAEDGPDNRRLIMTFLQRAGATVELAENGRQAVEQATAAAKRGEPYDLVLMDMQMPEMDGYAAARELRARGVRAPLLALTAHAMTGERERCLAAGCDDYMTKPIERAAFLAFCRAWMDRGRRAAAA